MPTSDPLENLIVEPTPAQRQVQALRSRLGEAELRAQQLRSDRDSQRRMRKKHEARIAELERREFSLMTQVGQESLQRMDAQSQAKFFKQAANELCEALFRQPDWRQRRRIRRSLRKLEVS